MENIQLVGFGLSEKETRVYLTLLASGASSVADTAQRSRMNRVSLYEVLKTLTEKKLVAISYKGKRKVYVAQPPQKIKDMLQDTLRDFDALLPQLLLLSDAGLKKPKVVYREGIEGIKDVFRDSLKAQEKIIVGISGIDALTSKDKALLTFWEMEYIPKRIKNGVRVRLVVPDTPAGKKLKSLDQDHLRESRLLPATTYNFECEMWVFDDVLSFISYTQGEEFGLSIKSKPIANSFKMMWRVLWNEGY